MNSLSTKLSSITTCTVAALSLPLLLLGAHHVESEWWSDCRCLIALIWFKRGYLNRGTKWRRSYTFVGMASSRYWLWFWKLKLLIYFFSFLKRWFYLFIRWSHRERERKNEWEREIKTSISWFTQWPRCLTHGVCPLWVTRVQVFLPVRGSFPGTFTASRLETECLGLKQALWYGRAMLQEDTHFSSQTQ